MEKNIPLAQYNVQALLDASTDIEESRICHFTGLI